MGSRSGGSYGKSARPKFEGGTGGMSRKYRPDRGGRSLPSAVRSLGAAAYGPAVIESAARAVDRVISRLTKPGR